MSTTIDGLISGLNTTQIISQLMAAERLPEQQLQKHQATDQSLVSTLQQLNSLFTSLKTAAAALVPDTITGQSAWSAQTATSSDPTVATATAGPSAKPGSLTFAVTSVAAAGSAVSSGAVGSTSTAVTDGPLTLTKGGTTTTINVAAGTTLDGVVAAINGAGAGVQATAVQVSAGQYKLQIASTTTGSGTDVSMSFGTLGGAPSPLGTTQQLAAGADTILHVGGTAPGAYNITSATTTVTGVLPDVSISVAKVSAAPVTLTVANDTTSLTAKMQSLVDGTNAVLKNISSQSGYDASTKTGGPLMGNSLAIGLVQQISSAVIGTARSTPAMLGVSLQQDGTIAFDQAKFAAAYAKDPVGTQAGLQAMAQQLSTVAGQASDPISGSLTGQITSYQSDISDLTAQIAAFEERMTLKQQSLQAEFSNLETALGSLKSQSSWLAGQIATLPTSYK